MAFIDGDPRGRIPKKKPKKTAKKAQPPKSTGLGSAVSTGGNTTAKTPKYLRPKPAPMQGPRISEVIDTTLPSFRPATRPPVPNSFEGSPRQEGPSIGEIDTDLPEYRPLRDILGERSKDPTFRPFTALSTSSAPMQGPKINEINTDLDPNSVQSPLVPDTTNSMTSIFDVVNNPEAYNFKTPRAEKQGTTDTDKLSKIPVGKEQGPSEIRTPEGLRVRSKDGQLDFLRDSDSFKRYKRNWQDLMESMDSMNDFEFKQKASRMLDNKSQQFQNIFKREHRELRKHLNEAALAFKEGDFDYLEREVLSENPDAFKRYEMSDHFPGETPEDLERTLEAMVDQTSNLEEEEAVRSYMEMKLTYAESLSDYIYDGPASYNSKLEESLDYYEEQRKKAIANAKTYNKKDIDPDAGKIDIGEEKSEDEENPWNKILKRSMDPKDFAEYKRTMKMRNDLQTVDYVKSYISGVDGDENLKREIKAIKKSFYAGRGKPYRMPTMKDMVEAEVRGGTLDPDDEEAIKIAALKYSNPFHPETRGMYLNFAVSQGLVDPTEDEETLVDYIGAPLKKKYEEDKKYYEEQLEYHQALHENARKEREENPDLIDRTLDALWFVGAPFGMAGKEVIADPALATLDFLERPLNAVAGIVNEWNMMNTDQDSWLEDGNLAQKVVAGAMFFNPANWAMKALTGHGLEDSLDNISMGGLADTAVAGWRGLTGSRDKGDRIDFRHVIANEADRDGVRNFRDENWFQNTVGITADIVLDPLNFVGVGMVANTAKYTGMAVKHLRPGYIKSLEELGRLTGEDDIVKQVIQNINSGLPVGTTVDARAASAMEAEQILRVADELEEMAGVAKGRAKQTAYDAQQIEQGTIHNQATRVRAERDATAAKYADDSSFEQATKDIEDLHTQGKISDDVAAAAKPEPKTQVWETTTGRLAAMQKGRKRVENPQGNRVRTNLQRDIKAITNAFKATASSMGHSRKVQPEYWAGRARIEDQYRGSQLTKQRDAELDKYDENWKRKNGWSGTPSTPSVGDPYALFQQRRDLVARMESSEGEELIKAGDELLEFDKRFIDEFNKNFDFKGTQFQSLEGVAEHLWGPKFRFSDEFSREDFFEALMEGGNSRNWTGESQELNNALQSRMAKARAATDDVEARFKRHGEDNPAPPELVREREAAWHHRNELQDRINTIQAANQLRYMQAIMDAKKGKPNFKDPERGARLLKIKGQYAVHAQRVLQAPDRSYIGVNDDKFIPAVEESTLEAERMIQKSLRKHDPVPVDEAKMRKIYESIRDKAMGWSTNNKRTAEAKKKVTALEKTFDSNKRSVASYKGKLSRKVLSPDKAHELVTKYDEAVRRMENTERLLKAARLEARGTVETTAQSDKAFPSYENWYSLVERNAKDHLPTSSNGRSYEWGMDDFDQLLDDDTPVGEVIAAMQMDHPAFYGSHQQANFFQDLIRRELAKVSYDKVKATTGPRLSSIPEINPLVDVEIPPSFLGDNGTFDMDKLNPYLVKDAHGRITGYNMSPKVAGVSPLLPEEVQFMTDFRNAWNDLYDKAYDKTYLDTQRELNPTKDSRVRSQESGVVTSSYDRSEWAKATGNKVTYPDLKAALLSGDLDEVYKFIGAAGSPFKFEGTLRGTKFSFLTKQQNRGLFKYKTAATLRKYLKDDLKLPRNEQEVVLREWTQAVLDDLFELDHDAVRGAVGDAPDVNVKRADDVDEIHDMAAEFDDIDAFEAYLSSKATGKELTKSAEAKVKKVFGNTLEASRKGDSFRKVEQISEKGLNSVKIRAAALTNSEISKYLGASQLPTGHRNVRIQIETKQQLKAQARSKALENYRNARNALEKKRDDLRAEKKTAVRNKDAARVKELNAELNELKASYDEVMTMAKASAKSAEEQIDEVMARLREETILQATTVRRGSNKALRAYLGGFSKDLTMSDKWLERMESVMEFPVLKQFYQAYQKTFQPPSNALKGGDLALAYARYTNNTPEIIRQNMEILAKNVGKIDEAERTHMFHWYRKFGHLEDSTYDGPSVELYHGFEEVMDRILDVVNYRSPSHMVKDSIGSGTSWLTRAEINRFLTDDYKLDLQSLPTSRKITYDDLIDSMANYRQFHGKGQQAARDINDPFRMAHVFMLASEQAMSHRALKNSLVETFGVARKGEMKSVKGGKEFVATPDSIVEELGKEGWELIPRLGNNAYFPPHTAKGINKMLDLMDDPRSLDEFAGLLDEVIGMWKATQTIYNPGWYTRNGIGEMASAWLSGVNKAKPYNKAFKVIKYRTGMGVDFANLTKHYDVLKGLNRPRPVGEKEHLITLGGNRYSVSDVELAFRQYGLKSGFIHTDLGRGAKQMGVDIDGKKTGKVRGGMRAGRNKLQDIGEHYEDFFRMAHFIDAMEKSGAKTLDGAAKYAAERVRRAHFDYKDYNKMEKSVMLRAFPFYKWTRKSIPFFINMLFLKPGKMMAAPKAMTGIQGLLSNQDINEDTNGFAPDYSGMVPAFVSDLWAYQIDEIGSEPGYANYFRFPLPQMDFFSMLAEPQGVAGSMLNPLIKAPIDMGLSAAGVDKQLDNFGIFGGGDPSEAAYGVFQDSQYNETRGIGDIERTVRYLSKYTPQSTWARKGIDHYKGNNSEEIDPWKQIVSAMGIGTYQGFTRPIEEDIISDEGSANNESSTAVGSLGLPEVPMSSGPQAASRSTHSNMRDLANLLKILDGN